MKNKFITIITKCYNQFIYKRAILPFFISDEAIKFDVLETQRCFLLIPDLVCYLFKQVGNVIRTSKFSK